MPVQNLTATSAVAVSGRIGATNYIRNNSMQGALAADGVELSVNGNFALNPISASQSTTQNGWQWANPGGNQPANFTWSAGSVHFGGDGVNTLSFGIAMSTVAGITYTVSFTADITGIAWRVGTVLGALGLGSGNGVLGANAVQFTAMGAVTWFSFSRISTGIISVSNISVQSAGKLPTNWNATTGTVVRTIISAGQVLVPNVGMLDYIDIRLSGTTSTTFINLTLDLGAVFFVGAGWPTSVSSYIALMAGSFTNITGFSLGSSCTSAPPAQSYLGEAGRTAYQGQLGTLGNLIRAVVNGATLANTFSTGAYFQIAFSNGVAIDLTFRIASPKHELVRAATAMNIRTASNAFASFFGFFYAAASLVAGAVVQSSAGRSPAVVLQSFSSTVSWIRSLLFPWPGVSSRSASAPAERRSAQVPAENRSTSAPPGT